GELNPSAPERRRVRLSVISIEHRADWCVIESCKEFACSVGSPPPLLSLRHARVCRTRAWALVSNPISRPRRKNRREKRLFSMPRIFGGSKLRDADDSTLRAL